MNCKRIIFALLAAALTAASAWASEEADKLLEQVVEWTKAKRTVEVEYTLNVGDEEAAGTMIIDGRRFRLRSDLLDAWFDGTNQWSYSPASDEVTISNPTEEELMQVNPYVIIDAFRRNYSAGIKPEKPGATHTVVLLTPLDAESDIASVEVSVPKGYAYPARIVVRTASGETLAINTQRIIRGKRFADSDFTYTPDIHPGAEVVDLR